MNHVDQACAVEVFKTRRSRRLRRFLRALWLYLTGPNP